MQQAKDSYSRSNVIISRLSCWEIQDKFELLHYDDYIGFYVSRRSSVGIATCCRLEGPQIKSRLGRDFPRPSRPALEPTQRLVQWISLLIPGVKAAGAWRWLPTPSNTDVKERVEPTSTPICAFTACSRLHFTLDIGFYTLCVPNEHVMVRAFSFIRLFRVQTTLYRYFNFVLNILSIWKLLVLAIFVCSWVHFV